MAELKNVCLLVVDMQNGFLGDRSRHVIPLVVQLVRDCRERGLPIVFTRFHNEAESQYERLIGWKRFRTSPEVDISPELSPYAEHVIEKAIYSAFTKEFCEMVERNHWRTIVLCGVATDGCILKTAIDAFERDLVPIVVADVCASHAGREVHDAGLMLLRRFIGKEQVINRDALLSKL